jgi:hypothetical protein
MVRPIGTVVLLTCSLVCTAADQFLVKAAAKVCAQRLYQQPVGGPFSVFLFCDDALGSNIGVINTSGGAGPGRIELGPTREWSKWNVNDRFWQQSEWATDVTSFAWSLDLKSLYVATSEIYGTGAVYKLDLVSRTFSTLVPDCREKTKYGCNTEIVSVDRKSGTVSVDVQFFNVASQRPETKRVQVK